MNGHEIRKNRMLENNNGNYNKMQEILNVIEKGPGVGMSLIDESNAQSHEEIEKIRQKNANFSKQIYKNTFSMLKMINTINAIQVTGSQIDSQNLNALKHKLRDCFINGSIAGMADNFNHKLEMQMLFNKHCILNSIYNQLASFSVLLLEQFGDQVKNEAYKTYFFLFFCVF